MAGLCSIMRFPIPLLAGLLFLAKVALAADEAWEPLFNGKDLAGWDTEMMILPDPKWEVPGLARGADGNYTTHRLAKITTPSTFSP